MRCTQANSTPTPTYTPRPGVVLGYCRYHEDLSPGEGRIQWDGAVPDHSTLPALLFVTGGPGIVILSTVPCNRELNLDWLQ